MKTLWNLFNYFVFLYPLYMSFVWIIGALLFYWRREMKPRNSNLDTYPSYSIIIPAHNEEGDIEETIENLRNLDYPSYKVLVVDDGSTDRTAEIIDTLADKYPGWLKAVHLMPNSGKSKAINAGVLLCEGELILIVDADCLVDKNILKMMAWHFAKSPTVGAVTGNPRIRNRTTLLGKIQIGEYSSIIGLIKRAQRILGKILTVSGVVASFRKSAFIRCGLFSSDTVTEDIDMTWKLERAGWDVRFEPRALAWILTPETIKGLWNQRVRWAQGGIEVMKKHRDIWLHFSEKRLWPVYLEYVVSIFWAFSVAFMLLSWLSAFVLCHFNIPFIRPICYLVSPSWAGGILATMCLIQTLISLYIDSRYESRSLLRYYYWIIWYPFFYWMINAAAALAGFCNVFVFRKGVRVTWKSPDRGLQTLR